MKSRARLRIMPRRSLAPNVVTVLALCAGMSSIKFALSGRWEIAVGAIFLAALLDTLDGRVARMVKGTSRFGAELDSLADVISFGVAPAVLIYLWTLSSLGGIGWVLALAFAVCCALRLARFNVMSTDDQPPSAFFVGLPSPMAAGLALWPLVLSFQFPDSVLARPAAVAPYVAPYFALVGLLMVSQIPTFSLKRLKVQGDYMLPALLFVGLLAASLSVYTWETVSFACFAYLVSIPFSLRAGRRRERLDEALAAEAVVETKPDVASGDIVKEDPPVFPERDDKSPRLPLH
ncbi:CDP-diacylglycerol--serine O-phosphatidyltransferase [Govanella unica]|uniref:CDP-diacylglycerol--serine O-phosphatidyltransferase n=1 Tax=Govanella unica TaxID=2975056 RepID=A0A9X3Z6T2_9PROT|nr:CDP-diacylglycerol--serine O-phosphatidyltransferase [Govania unica]MDA5193264.1 CDP-diacylglycerol--serine O-phosphatidyltransferase [Govania unica]